MLFEILLPTILCLNHFASSEIIIGTWSGDFKKAVQAGGDVLSRGGSSLDAVETACRTCEELQCERTVGYGGSPDEHGETTLDAIIIDGTTMNMGAVAGLRRVKNVIGVARKVLDNTKHSMLAGDLATQFATSMGFPEEPLSTRESKRKWNTWHDSNCQPNFWINVKPDPKTSCGPYKARNFLERFNMKDANEDIGNHNHDTIGVVAIDGKGNMAAGTSTNGANHKIGGRVGDSPLPGAGAYAVTGVGGAAATGDGDIMLRFLPSFLTVELLRSGHTVQEAVQTSVGRIAQHYPNFSGAVIGISQQGEYAAACHGMREFPYNVAKRTESGEWQVIEHRVDWV
uniref:N(4)-(beta-N-acetylglucosaminyl)-L-asparaginase n=1 Tax=Cacopsylla melanoneura TaxID=428564 RepID=A0A8D8LR59_9HEMI